MKHKHQSPLQKSSFDYHLHHTKIMKQHSLPYIGIRNDRDYYNVKRKVKSNSAPKFVPLRQNYIRSWQTSLKFIQERSS